MGVALLSHDWYRDRDRGVDTLKQDGHTALQVLPIITKDGVLLCLACQGLCSTYPSHIGVVFGPPSHRVVVGRTSQIGAVVDLTSHAQGL